MDSVNLVNQRHVLPTGEIWLSTYEDLWLKSHKAWIVARREEKKARAKTDAAMRKADAVWAAWEVAKEAGAAKLANGGAR